MNSSITKQIPWAMLTAMLVASPAVALAQASPASRDAVVGIVTRIQRADYEGDRADLRRLFQSLTPSNENQRLASRVRYWRGFAMWRRAFNGLNDSTDRADIEQDLQQAVHEFEEAVKQDPGFVDATSGAASCLQALTFLHQTDATRVTDLVARFVPLFKESLAAAPDNPRLLWVHGGSQWYSPPTLPAAEVSAHQTAAIATYEHGLRLARQQKGTIADPLEPSWGEPELLMSLAWSHLNKTIPDVRISEEYARQAASLIPYWHYVVDILAIQIQHAKDKQR